MTTIISPVQVDSSRIESYVNKVKARAEEVENFMTSRLNKLALLSDKFEKFSAAVKATELTIGNMYSSHIGDEQYTEEASLIAHVTFKPKTFYKNEKTAETRYQTFLNEYLLNVASTRTMFRFDYIAGTVSFQIWVK